MYPVYQVRLGHRERLRFKQVGHGQREDLHAGRIGFFSEPYLHYNFSNGLTAWLRKHVKYAEDEARLLGESKRGNSASIGATGTVAQRRALKSLSRLLPFALRPIARALYMLIVRRAFLDGRAGLLYVGMVCVYEAMMPCMHTTKNSVLPAVLLQHRQTNAFLRPPLRPTHQYRTPETVQCHFLQR